MFWSVFLDWAEWQLQFYSPPQGNFKGNLYHNLYPGVAEDARRQLQMDSEPLSYDNLLFPFLSLVGGSIVTNVDMLGGSLYLFQRSARTLPVELEIG